MSAPAVVLHVANFAERLGGGEENVLALVHGLDRRRFEPCATVPGEGEMARELRRAALPVALHAQPPLRPWRAVAMRGAVRGLRARLREWRVALVHAHGSRGAFYAGLAARPLGVPLVWHARIADRDPLLDAVLLRLCTRVVAVSRAVAGRFEGSPQAAKVRVVYNGVDPGWWIPGRRERPPGAAPTVLLIGRLMADKGQAALVEAAPAVLRRHPAARFVLLGADAGGQAERLRALARRVGADGALTIRAWTADPRAAVEAADLVALPSRTEGFGRVLVEAGLMEKPVVATRVGGIPEVVVHGETGLLVERDDVEGLASAINALLDDGGLRRRLGEAARRRALERFTLRHHVAGVEAVYDEVLSAPGASRSDPSARRRVAG